MVLCKSTKFLDSAVRQSINYTRKASGTAKHSIFAVVTQGIIITERCIIKIMLWVTTK